MHRWAHRRRVLRRATVPADVRHDRQHVRAHVGGGPVARRRRRVVLVDGDGQYPHHANGNRTVSCSRCRLEARARCRRRSWRTRIAPNGLPVIVLEGVHLRPFVPVFCVFRMQPSCMKITSNFSILPSLYRTCVYRYKDWERTNYRGESH
jgi:hypothetical protein